MRIAFIYPGQGAQKAGMGKDFYEKSSRAKRVFNESTRLLGCFMQKLCFEENELLNRTDYTQAALVTTCLAMTEEILHQGIIPDITAGLSLGEYCAISAAGGMSFSDAIRTIRVRGQLMHTAVPENFGGMLAVLGLSGARAEAVTEEIPGVSVANYNCPGQVVITGEKRALARAEETLKRAGAKRVVGMHVSGPFHSPYMTGAGEKLGEQLERVEWKPLTVPYVANVNAKTVTDISLAPELLKRQVYSPVLWEQSVGRMLEEGVDTFIEIGPGKTLSRLVKKTAPGAQVYTISTMEELAKVKEALKEKAVC